MTGEVLDIEAYNPEGMAEANHCLKNYHFAVKIAEKKERRKAK